MTGFDAGDGQGSMTGVASQVNDTRTWARVLSVMNYIAGALMLCVGGGIVLAGGMLPGLEGGGRFLGLFYIVLALVYVYPGMQLGRVATQSSAFNRSTSLSDLESYLTAVRRTFKFYALLMIVGLLFGIVVIVGGIALGGLAALTGRT